MVSAKDLELAQVSVIGSLLLEPSLTGEVLLRLPDGDFLSDVCRTVYQAIRALFQAGETIDPVTVRQTLASSRSTAPASSRPSERRRDSRASSRTARMYSRTWAVVGVSSIAWSKNVFHSVPPPSFWRTVTGDALLAVMGRALRAQMAGELWRRGIGIPYACRWLKNRRWEDAPLCTPAHGPWWG